MHLPRMCKRRIRCLHVSMSIEQIEGVVTRERLVRAVQAYIGPLERATRSARRRPYLCRGARVVLYPVSLRRECGALSRPKWSALVVRTFLVGPTRCNAV